MDEEELRLLLVEEYGYGLAADDAVNELLAAAPRLLDRPKSAIRELVATYAETGQVPASLAGPGTVPREEEPGQFPAPAPEPDRADLPQVDRDIQILDARSRILEGESTIAEEAEGLGITGESLEAILSQIAVAENDPRFINSFGFIPSSEDYQEIARLYEERTDVPIGIQEISLLHQVDPILRRAIAEVGEGKHTTYVEVNYIDRLTGDPRRASVHQTQWDTWLSVVQNDSHLAQLVAIAYEENLVDESNQQELGWFIASAMTPTELDAGLGPALADTEAALVRRVEAQNYAARRRVELEQELEAQVAEIRGPEADPFRMTDSDRRHNEELIRREIKQMGLSLDEVPDPMQRERQMAKRRRALLAMYGGSPGSRYLARVAEVLGPAVANDLRDRGGPSTRLEAEEIQRKVFDTLRPEQWAALGIDLSSEFYQALTTSQEELDSEVQYRIPDPAGLKEAQLNLYSHWFGDDPSDADLSRFVSVVDNALRDQALTESRSQRKNVFALEDEIGGRNVISTVTPDPNALLLEQARRDPRYRAYFGKRKAGETEDEYIGRFTMAASETFGTEAAQNKEARLAGQQTGDVSTTLGQLLFSKESARSETFVNKAARLARMIERMT